MAGFDFLANALIGLAANSVVSGLVGAVIGVGATIAMHPVIIASGVILGGTVIATMRAIVKDSERPNLRVIDGGRNG